MTKPRIATAVLSAALALGALAGPASAGTAERWRPEGPPIRTWQPDGPPIRPW